MRFRMVMSRISSWVTSVSSVPLLSREGGGLVPLMICCTASISVASVIIKLSMSVLFCLMLLYNGMTPGSPIMTSCVEPAEPLDDITLRSSSFMAYASKMYVFVCFIISSTKDLKLSIEFCNNV